MPSPTPSRKREGSLTLSPAFLDELRARTQLSTLIGRSVKLARAGREFKACCPFHNEKTPSFTVNDDKGFYHCFGCSAHGDAIRWLTDQQGLPFMEAVKELADAAGMEVPAPDSRAQERAERAAGLHDVMAAAARWFQEQLDGVDGAAARAYLDTRGIKPATRARFGFGFAPDNRGRLKAALAHLGPEKLVEAGLVIEAEGRDSYDRFRGRLMFPIRDQRGRVIAFGGRILGDGEPKYLNSPETPLFDKGRTLFNLDLAGPMAIKSGNLLVVEGYMDAITLHAAGMEAVAPLGTALTETQLNLLWRYCDKPALCFDGDAAGQRASLKAALRALPLLTPGKTLRVVELPSGKDPDDLARSANPEAFVRELSQFIWKHEFSVRPLRTPEDRAGLQKRLSDHVATINDPSVREQYRQDFRSEFDRMYRQGNFAPQRRAKETRREGHRPFRPRGSVAAGARTIGSDGTSPAVLRAILYGLSRFPEEIAAHSEAIAALPILDRGAAALRDAMLDAALAHAALDPDRLNTILALTGAAAFMEGLRAKHGLAFSFTRRDAEPERARRDLVLAIETLAARPALDAAYLAATERLKAGGGDEDFSEQVRLRAAREEAERTLASLIVDGGGHED